MITYRDIIAPFNFKKATRGLNWKGKTIAVLYFPAILLVWYGYYMWNKHALFIPPLFVLIKIIDEVSWNRFEGIPSFFMTLAIFYTLVFFVLIAYIHFPAYFKRSREKNKNV